MEQPNTDAWWRLYLQAGREGVYEILATDAGRRQFWAVETEENDGMNLFRILGGLEWQSRILEPSAPERFSVEDIDGSATKFALAGDGEGGTDLLLTDYNVPAVHLHEVTAAWGARSFASRTGAKP